MDKLVVLGITALVILFALVACGLVALLLLPQPAPHPPSPNATNATPPLTPTTNTTGNASITDAEFQLWLKINKANVESACYEKARQEAGANAWAVQGCTCQETATPERKRYDCSIDTSVQAGTYFAKVDCTLADQQCIVTTNFGSQTVTFDQLAQMYAQSGN